MKNLSSELKVQYEKGLQQYLLQKDEQSLTQAYELGRKFIKEGLGELRIIEVHHQALSGILEDNEVLDASRELKKADTYLMEILAPYEIRQQGYKELIERLHKNNDRLKDEIAKRKASEEEQKKSKQYFKLLIENAQDIITVLNPDGTVRSNSPSVERVLGYAPDEMEGELIFDYVHPNDVESLKEIFYKGIEIPGFTISEEYRIGHKAGGWRTLESVAKNVYDNPDEHVIIVNSRDITDRLEAMQKLEESRKQLVEAQKIARVGSWQWELERGRRVSWSEEMFRIYDLKRDQFSHTYEGFLKCVHPDDREMVKQTVEDALDRKESFSIEHKIIRGNGKERIIHARGDVLLNEDSSVHKMMGTAQDITEQKQNEEKLRRYSEDLRKLSARLEKAREEERIKIARELHDELGQMLTVLKMDFSLVFGRISKDLPEKMISSVKSELDKVMDRVDTIITSVQRISTELRPEVLDNLGLKEAIQWQAGEFEKKTGIKLDFNSNIRKSDFLDDERATALFRIFQETLTNIYRHAGAQNVSIELRKESDSIKLKVMDDGVGISEKELQDSSSLGIISMRERTQLLGGSVRFQGEEGKGSTVMLQLPINAVDTA